MKNILSSKELNYLSNIGNSDKVVKRPQAERAFKSGQEVWSLFKGHGPYLYVVDSRENALQAFLDYYNIPKLPKDWYFEKVTKELLDRYYDPNVSCVASLVTVKDILYSIKKLPKPEMLKLKKDLDELNDYILTNYPDYYESKIEPLRYTTDEGEYIFLRELAKKI